MELQDQSQVFKQRYRALLTLIFNTWVSHQFLQSFRNLSVQTSVQHAKKTHPDRDLEQTLGITSQSRLTGCIICLLNLV